MFSIECGGQRVSKQFATDAAAREWAAWNYKGEKGWRVVPFDILPALRAADANPSEVESWRDLVSAAADEIERLRGQG